MIGGKFLSWYVDNSSDYIKNYEQRQTKLPDISLGQRIRASGRSRERYLAEMVLLLPNTGGAIKLKIWQENQKFFYIDSGTALLSNHMKLFTEKIAF